MATELNTQAVALGAGGSVVLGGLVGAERAIQARAKLPAGEVLGAAKWGRHVGVGLAAGAILGTAVAGWLAYPALRDSEPSGAAHGAYLGGLIGLTATPMGLVQGRWGLLTVPLGAAAFGAWFGNARSAT